QNPQTVAADRRARSPGAVRQENGRQRIPVLAAPVLAADPVRFKIGPSSDYLLVDARTYLPLRTLISKDASVRRYDYQYLPSTAANLAELTAPIPPGFRRTAQPVTPKNGPPFHLETEAPAEPGHSGR